MNRVSPAILRFLATSAIALAVPLTALAQTASAPASSPEHRGHPGEPVVMHMLRGLDLTESQRSQIKALADSQREAMRSSMQKVRDLRRSLHEQAFSDKYDAAAASAKADQLARAEADLARLTTENMQKIYALLTPAQQTKLKERLSRHEEHEQRRPGGPRHDHRGK